MSESANWQINPEAEPSPAVRDLAEEFRRRLGTLDPQQVAIWRQMTPAQKIKLAFQMWAAGLNEIWTIGRQRHPDATQEDLAWHVLRYL
jgi:hypothetical protein